MIKGLKELCTIRDACNDLLKYYDNQYIKDLLDKTEDDIKNYTDGV